MTPKDSIAVIEELGKLLKEEKGDILRKSIEKLYNILMRFEAETVIGASKYERTSNRKTYLKSTREVKTPLKTTVGNIELTIPKICNGNYYPSFIEPRRLTDKSLVSVIQQAYINGVSTRKVDNLVESLGLNIDKSKISRLCKEIDTVVYNFKNRHLEATQYSYLYIDATFPKVRKSGNICSMCFFIAIAINKDGDREVLGFDVAVSECEDSWKHFLQSLVNRGLKGVKLVISDANSRLKSAISSVLTGGFWQRCRVHFMRNVLDQVLHKYKNLVSATIKTIFASENKEDAKNQLRLVCEQLYPKFPKAVSIIENAEDEILTFMDFPQKHWKSIFSTNLLERLTKEIRRRTNVVSIFPDRASVIRLACSILLEYPDEWYASDRRFLSKETMSKLYLDSCYFL